MLKILYALKNPINQILSLLEGHWVDTVCPDESLFIKLSQKNYELILVEEETELIADIKAADPRAEVVLFSSEEIDAVEAVAMGAFACFSLPFDQSERLREILDTIADIVQTRVETAELEKQLTSKYTFAGIVGKNPQMLDIFNFMRRIAPYFRTMTIMGETGTGKETLAKTLHSLTPAAKYPFIAVNCGVLGANLIESELFGHKRGSFTGAVADKVGLFEAAGEGTVFLDEIGELPLSVQPHLLRVLQDGECRPIGSTRSVRARCKVIAATHRNLEEEVRQHRFRQDLFYRLTPLTITVPPLRDRKDDLPLLCRHILQHFSGRTGKKLFGISRPAQSALFAFGWPGNVRMLENAIEYAAIMAKESYIKLEDLPSYLLGDNDNGRSKIFPPALDDMIRSHIEEILVDCHGNRSRAAEKLGINRNALLRKLKKYSIN
jgi:DNA-binding NtrC family response regulator